MIDKIKHNFKYTLPILAPTLLYHLLSYVQLVATLGQMLCFFSVLIYGLGFIIGAMGGVSKLYPTQMTEPLIGINNIRAAKHLVTIDWGYRLSVYMLEEEKEQCPECGSTEIGINNTKVFERGCLKCKHVWTDATAEWETE